MGYKINENKTSIVPFQSGSGIPNHLSPRGSVYIDNLTGTEYINKDGYNTWAFLYDSTMSISGGTSSGGTITGLTANNGLSASTTNNVTTIGFSGGNINNSTNFINGLTANTFSATTISGGTFFGNGSNLSGVVHSVGLSMPSAFSVSNSPITDSGTLAVTATGTTNNFVDGTGSLQLNSNLTLCNNPNTLNNGILRKGTVVFVSGSTGNRPAITRAVASGETSSARTFGIVIDDIAVNANGYVLSFGQISDLDTRTNATYPFTTNTLADGDVIYLSPTNAGYVTNVKPSAPNHMVYLGTVIRTHPTLGDIDYRIQNGFELQELHNVAINGVANRDILQYNSSNQLWENKNSPIFNSLSSTTISSTTITATNYIGLPLDIRVTGGTVTRSSNLSSLVFTNNIGSGFTVASIFDTFVTGGTVSRVGNLSTVNLVNNSGDTISVSPFFDTFTTGATLSGGVATFTTNSGQTYTLSGFPDTFTTGYTYNNANTFSLQRNQGQAPLTATINIMTGLTVSNSFNSSGSTLNVAQTINSGATGGIYSLISGNTVDSATAARSVRALDLSIDSLSGTDKSQLVFTNHTTLGNSMVNLALRSPSLFINRVSGSAGLSALYFSDSGIIRAGIRNNTSGLIDIGSFSTGGWIPTFYSNNAEAARFGTTGNFLINTTSDSGDRLQVNGTSQMTANTANQNVLTLNKNVTAGNSNTDRGLRINNIWSAATGTFGSSVIGVDIQHTNSVSYSDQSGNVVSTLHLQGGGITTIFSGANNNLFGIVRLNPTFLDNAGGNNNFYRLFDLTPTIVLTGATNSIVSGGFSAMRVEPVFTGTATKYLFGAVGISSSFNISSAYSNVALISFQSAPTIGNQNALALTGYYHAPTIATGATPTYHRAFWNTTGDNYFNSTSGNMGIGTVPTTSYKLDVSGTTRLNGNARIEAFLSFSGAPSAWGSFTNAIQLSTASITSINNITYIGNNTFFSTNWRWQNTAPSARMEIQDGFKFFIAPSGTGGQLITGATQPVTISSNGNLLVGTTSDAGYKLDVSGITRINVTGITNVGLTVTGQNTKGGAGYTDFLLVTNTNTGATNPNKYFRLNSIGGLEILNSVYTASTLTLTDTGILSVGGGNLATTSSSDGVTNYLMLGNNNTQIYDDGNTHIHSRDASKAMWINTNGGQLNLLTQSPTSTGGIGSGIAIATTTLNGYVTINTGTTISTAAAYGYLTTAGAGTYPGGSQSVPISLYATNRIWGQEIDAFSDERMKNIMGEINLEDGINLVKKLKPIKYTWKEGEDKGVKAGYSAQQVSKSGFNHLISLIPRDGLEETIDDDGFLSPKNTQFSMNYDQVTPYHGVVIKYLLEKIEALEKEINELKNK
jgi:hypothetical protein